MLAKVLPLRTALHVGKYFFFRYNKAASGKMVEVRNKKYHESEQKHISIKKQQSMAVYEDRSELELAD